MTRNLVCAGTFGLMVVLAACAVDNQGSGTAESATMAKDPEPTTRGSRNGKGSDGGTVVSASDGGTTVTTDGGDGGGFPSCYAGLGTCSPTDPSACEPGWACDINGSTREFQCFEPPNDSQLGNACNNATGPFCAHGLACNAGTCVKYCCDDSGCAAGTTCTPTGTVGSITIRVCL